VQCALWSDAVSNTKSMKNMSPQHQAIVQMIHLAPHIVVQLMTMGWRKLRLPRYHRAHLYPSDAGFGTSGHHADTVVALENAKGRTLRAFVAEVQRSPEKVKFWVWPLYVASVRAKLRCLTTMLVICTNDRVAQWARRIIPDSVARWCDMLPVLWSPSNFPATTDPSEARETPELAALSCLLLHQRADWVRLFDTAVAGLATLDRDLALRYIGILHMGLAEQPQRQRDLEERMSTKTYDPDGYVRELVADWLTQGRAEGEAKGLAEGEAKGLAEGEAKGLAEGEAKGLAKALLSLLEHRGVAITNVTRERVNECTDQERLMIWYGRALDATSIDQVFD
jgi:hypothetical protein